MDRRSLSFHIMGRVKDIFDLAHDPGVRMARILKGA